MEHTKQHITSYKTYGIILILLLCFTSITVFVTRFDLKTWNVAIALLIASTKATIVVLYFMHIKFESRLIKVLVAGVTALFAVFIALTLFDYIFR